MIEIRVRGLLLDMDGVLVRSEGSIERAWTAWARRNDMDPAETFRAAHGRRSIDTVRALRPDLDADVEDAFIENLEVTDNHDLVILPGVLRLAAAIPRAQWTVVTSASAPLATERLRVGGIPVPQRFISGGDVANGKPDPEGYAKGAAVLGLAPADCLVVEDAPAGVAAGRAAGCVTLAVAARHEWAALSAADYRVESLADVAVTVSDGEIWLRF